ncbi:MAG: two-component regulator propeller domain-containing protein [Bacteroidota bacterium]|nr:two-component regulator propeller domain-containing protein [Bacteroidota bacterium]
MKNNVIIIPNKNKNRLSFFNSIIVGLMSFNIKPNSLIKKLFVLFFICLGSLKSFSQVFSFKNFTEDDGLSQSFIYDICQDKRGFLIVATGDGLSAFGGSNFKVFKTNSGLAEIGITTLFKDSKNKIWLGHFEGGVSYVMPTGKIGKVNFKEPLNSKLIQIVEIEPNNYVFLKKNLGIVLYNSETGSVNNIEDDVFSETVSLLVNKDELLLLKPDGLYSIKIKNLLAKNYKIEQIIKLKEGAFMQFDIPKEKILIADNIQGLLTYKNEKNKIALDTFKLKRPNGSVFTKVISDRFSNIYVATTDDGYFKINPAEKFVKNYTIKNGLTSNAIQSLFIDREDNLWVGTYGYGLQQLNNEMYSYRFIRDQEGMKIPINSIVRVNGKTAVATGNGVGFINEDKVDFIKNAKVANKRFVNLNLFKNNFVFSTLDGKLFRSDTLFNNIVEIPLFTTNQSLVINSLNSDEKNIYACTSAGLYVINAENFKYQVLNTESGLMHNNVKFIFIDSKKHMWICSQGSLIYYMDNLNEIKMFDDVKGLKSFNIQTVCEDENKNIWISSLGDGVFKYNGKKFENFGVINGLKSAYSYAIVADYKNGIWVTHANAISYKNKNKKNFNRIGGNSILLQNNFIENAVCYDKAENEIFYGTTEGIVKINTAKQRFNEVEPVLSILNISINGDRIENLKDTLLKYNSYDLSFDFIGVCLTDPEKVKYRYKLKLEGAEDNWEIISGEQRKLNFPKLKTGDYTFMIYASNNDGLWNSKPVTFRFIIDRPFWLKWWFIIIAISVAAFFIYIGIKLRTKKLIQNQKELEHKIHLQTIEIRAEKEHVQNMNKELKTLHDDLTDSINYAKNIQSSIIPVFENALGPVDIFECFQPKDIVGGDFYGYYLLPDNNKIVFLADCTGHGVPGGFLTVIAKALLDKIVIEMKVYEPKEVIYKLNSEFRMFFGGNSNDENVRYEGLVISLCHINYSTKLVEICVAGNPFYYSKNSEVVSFKGSRSSVGYEENMGELNLLQLPISKDLRLYMFSDGLQDQFGGDSAKRFSSKRVSGSLNLTKHLSVKEQGNIVLEEWNMWKGSNEQVDDVSLIIMKFE